MSCVENCAAWTVYRHPLLILCSLYDRKYLYGILTGIFFSAQQDFITSHQIMKAVSMLFCLA